jgi:hypothetical protein
MTTKYIIMKSSRAFDNPTAPWAYRGPTCADAGVEPGKVYDNKAEAEIDAQKLTNCNPVGFVVLELKHEHAKV